MVHFRSKIYSSWFNHHAQFDVPMSILKDFDCEDLENLHQIIYALTVPFFFFFISIFYSDNYLHKKAKFDHVYNSNEKT